MKTWLFVVLLITVSAMLRLWAIGSVPPSPDWDEVALGYNAYSILHTGRDEYGAFMPVVMRSFDDYKPALYSYLIIPFLFMFGLSIQAVRMPSVVFGVITVVAVFFMCEELFHRKNLSFLIALFLAISPWHMQFSRIGFESNIGLSLNILGAILLIKGLKRPWVLFLSAVSFVASLYVYQSEKVFVPLFILLLIGCFWKQILKVSKKYIVGAFLLCVLLSLPMGLYLLTNPNALARAKGVSVFSDNSQLKRTSIRLEEDHKKHDYLGLLLDNRRVIFGQEVIANYLSHFDLKWLFITGDINRHHAPFMGLLYVWELPFIFLGVYFLLFSKYSWQTKAFIFGWMLLAPVPASVTTGVPHAVRTLNFLPTFQILTAFGLFGVYEILKHKKILANSFIILVTLFALFSFCYFLDQYFVQQNYYNSKDWQYGYAQAIPFVASLNASHVVVSNQEPLDQSYMFFLFYLTYNPALYQEETKNVSGGFAENHAFGPYEFRPINWNLERKGNTVFVGRPSDFPSGAHVLKSISYLDGTPAIEIVKE